MILPTELHVIFIMLTYFAIMFGPIIGWAIYFPRQQYREWEVRERVIKEYVDKRINESYEILYINDLQHHIKSENYDMILELKDFPKFGFLGTSDYKVTKFYPKNESNILTG